MTVGPDLLSRKTVFVRQWTGSVDWKHHGGLGMKGRVGQGHSKQESAEPALS